jgi:thymidylate synthase
VTEIIQIQDGRTGYRDVLEYVLSHGTPRKVRGRRTLDAGHVTIEIADPRYSLPLHTGRGLSRRVAAAEAVQLLGGFSNPELLPDSFDRFKEKDGTFWGAYGVRIGTQLVQAVRKLKKDPGTRQAVITLWDPILDNQPDKNDYPCTVSLGFQWDAVVGLELNVLMRSNDVYLGTPYDWFQFTQLQLSVARLLRTDVGRYRHTAWSLHIYEEDVDRAKTVTAPTQYFPHPTGIGSGSEVDAYELLARTRALADPRAYRALDLTTSERWYVDALHTSPR